MTLTQLRYVIEVCRVHSMNEAAKNLYISQPSLSAAIRELEDELGIEIFIRTNRGVSLTPDGEEFLGYARQVIDQYSLIENRYVRKESQKVKFSVAMQHYTFAVDAFVTLVKEYGMDDYDFAVYETKTNDVINYVKNFKSEVGVLYLNDFNRQVLTKILRENDLEFHRLFDCHIYVYLAKTNPLAKKDLIKVEDLMEYPCLAFDQGGTNSFYLAEELMSTAEYKKIIHACDRATLLNLFRGLNGFTLCSGIICEDLNGDDYCCIPLDSDELMSMGYITRKGVPLSPMGLRYVEILSEYQPLK